MIDWWSFYDVLRRPRKDPHIAVSYDFLYDEGLTKGVLVIGGSGTGKTSWLALHIVDYFLKHADEAIFVLDWSGSLTNNIFRLLLMQTNYQRLLKRIVYDDMGNPDIAIPMPEFSSKYGHADEQVHRVHENLRRLHPELERAPIVGEMGLTDATNFFHLLTATQNEYNECWQITETKKIIIDEELLNKLLKDFGNRVPDARYWIKESFQRDSKQGRKLSTKSIISVLGAIEPREVRARVGAQVPGWTPKEAIEKGLMVIVDGRRLINKERTQNYLFTQAYSLIMQEINKRIPDNPKDKPVSLVLDEVYSLLRVPGMAPEIASLSPQYRSRKLQLYIVLQELAQMSEELRPHIWSLGNVVSFAVANHFETLELAKQLFPYDPYTMKLAPMRDGQLPVMEQDQGQYLEYANWIRSFPHRQCIMRRYISEKEKEDKVQFIPETSDFPQGELYITVEEAKEYLLNQRGKSVRDLLENINNRTKDPPRGVPST